MNIQKLLMLSCATGALVGFTGAAHAQDSEGGIGEVVITAEKRAQSVQDVPVAVTAITSQQRDVMGITGIQDQVNFTPGMNYTGTDRVSLRGSGRLTFRLGSDPGVASYTDGFYSASSSELFKTPMFVQRTEIARGPQGTLSGRNSMGGSINIVSQRPTNEYEAEMRATVANFDSSRLEGYVSGPITDDVRFRLSLLNDQNREGFLENISTGGNQMTTDKTYMEAQLDWDVTPDLHFWMRYSKAIWDDTAGVGDRFNNLTTDYQFNNVNPPSSLVIPASYNYCGTNPAGNGQAAPAGPLYTAVCTGTGTFTNPGVADNYRINTNDEGHGTLHGNNLYTVHLDYDLPFAQLRYIGGYQEYVFTTGGDVDGTGRTDSYTFNLATDPFTLAPYSTTVFPQYLSEFREAKQYYTNEINLVSTGDGAFSWILGAYQYHEEYDQLVSWTAYNQPQLATALLVALDATSVDGAAPTFAPIVFGNNSSGEFIHQHAFLTSDAWAVFGQGEWAMSDTLALTVGLRYSHDEKSGGEDARLLFWNPSTTQFVLDVTPDVDPTPGSGHNRSRLVSDSWNAITGNINLAWTPSNDTLVYARYGRGYKAGGFQLATLSSDPSTDQEQVDAYEIGWKQDIGSRFQINTAVFFNDYQGLQIPLRVPNAAGSASEDLMPNLDAEAYGLEFEARWNPIDDLQFLVAYGYLHTEIGDTGCSPALLTRCFVDQADRAAVLPSANPVGAPYASGSSPNAIQERRQDVAGNQLPMSPEHKVAVNGNYTFHTGLGELVFSTSAFWTDSVTYGIFGNPIYEIDPYTTVDFRVLLNDIDDRFTIIGYVKNATDETGYSSTGVLNPTANYPYASNVVNSGGVGGLPIPGSYSLINGLIAPRTFGVELQMRF